LKGSGLMTKIKKLPQRPFTILDYIANLLSARESKFSTIAFVLLISFGLAIYLTLSKQAVPDWIKSAIQWSIIGLTGMNALGAGLNYMGYGGMGGYGTTYYDPSININNQTTQDITQQNNPNGGEL
jgi:hypothetical protein